MIQNLIDRGIQPWEFIMFVVGIVGCVACGLHALLKNKRR